jgi:hypothetical protein
VTITDLSAWLDDHGIAHAVIGAFALAVHGVVRASDDVDVLVVDGRCLEPPIWTEVERTGIAVEIRRGDADDPLAGVVRLQPADGTRIDIVVGKTSWQHDVITRARSTPLLGGRLPIALPADLVFLKLYAGGPQDAWDIDQILDAVPDLEAEIEMRVGVLPRESVALWRRIVGTRKSP